MKNVYESRLFRYTVIKKGRYYGLNIKRISNGENIGHGRNLLFNRERLWDFLDKLGLPDEFIKNVCE